MTSILNARTRTTILALVASLMLAAVAFAAMPGAASAASPDTAPAPAVTPDPSNAWPFWTFGQPTSFTPGGPAGWYVWTDADGVHLRTTSPHQDGHAFDGIVETDGAIAGMQGYHLEDADSAVVGPDNHRLVLKFDTHDGVDGVDFHVAGGTCMKFTLDLEGSPIATGRINIGHFNINPPNNPFTICR